MLRAVASAQIALLFIALALPTNAQKEVWLTEGAPGRVQCVVSDVSAARWARDEGALSPRWGASETKGATGVTAQLSVDRVTADLEGRYRCAPPPAPYIHVRVRPAHSAHLTATTSNPVADSVSTVEHKLMFDLRSGNLSLLCPLQGTPVTWSKNETAIEQIGELANRYDATAAEKGKFTITGKPFETDWGNYTCSVGAESHTWEVVGRPTAHIAENTNVVEGQRLRLVCTLKGRPYPGVAWKFTNDSLNATDVTAALGPRVALDRSEQGVEGGALLVESAERGDAGLYECVPLAEGATPAATTVRVKDMYAALWPFLGICAEVFVLCAVILIYERRRTKPECDDSDTDHDQKKS